MRAGQNSVINAWLEQNDNVEVMNVWLEQNDNVKVMNASGTAVSDVLETTAENEPLAPK